MDDERSQLLEQIDRCRRLARTMVDDELRHSLEELACEYEAELKAREQGFMLRDRAESR